MTMINPETCTQCTKEVEPEWDGGRYTKSGYVCDNCLQEYYETNDR